MSLSNVTNSPNIQNDIDRINWIIVLLVRWTHPIIFLFGVISNTLNLYVFTRPSLRQNPCCMYFLSSSITALIYTIINLPLRTLQYGYKIDPTTYLLSLCKIKYFFTFTWRALTSWYLVLGCFDRFLHSSSNVNLRQLSSFKVASRTILLTFILINIVYSHVLVFYKINLTSSCTSESSFYGTFLGIWHLLAYGIGPPLLMFLFSILTLQHVHRRRIMPVTIQSNRANRDANKDRHLLRMVFIQCLFVGLTTTAYACIQLYTSLTAYQIKDRLQLTKDNLFIIIFGSISATGHSTTFFVFVLTSKFFRQQLFRRHQERM
ncbi:unnamed protein product [Rotaria sordida]|uniref:G-protein coupled receptors family 1 profile domain-containing protein n=1 Tax=Rotaria sordida TaxID=392033 RepID=A0A819KAQ9_9BILA|nr:unnamed protein product [Rotaria sordida]